MNQLRRSASSNLGLTLLAIWLILNGAIGVVGLYFTGLPVLMGLLALAAGVLLLLGR